MAAGKPNAGSAGGLLVTEDNIIHVKFGPRGRKIPPPPRSQRRDPQPTDTRDPSSATYTMVEVARLFGLTVGKLRHWERTGVIARSGASAGRRSYTFQDLIGIRAAKGLVQAGVPLRNVRRSLDALRVSLPRVARPLSTMRVVADGRDILIRDPHGTYDPLTGQLCLDFDIKQLHEDVVRILHRTGRPNKQRQAYEQYLEGCRWDEDENEWERAVLAYRQALQLDPTLANAMTNLGNLLVRSGEVEEAEELYLRALRIDADQPEAFYNLGFLLFERGEIDAARGYFEQAVCSDPAFADAHFNLGMALQDLGRVAEARQHWSIYLELDPQSTWAEIARRHLDEF